MVWRTASFRAFAKRHFPLSATGSNTTDETIRLIRRRSLRWKCFWFLSVIVTTEKTVVCRDVGLGERPDLLSEKGLIVSTAVPFDQFRFVNSFVKFSPKISIQFGTKSPHAAEHRHAVLRVITHEMKEFVRSEPNVDGSTFARCESGVEITTHH